MKAPNVSVTAGGALSLAGVAVGGVALWWLLRKDASGKSGAQRLAEGAVGAAGDVAKGTVLAAGDAVGVPRTDPAKGADAVARGDLWDASFYLPASEFIHEAVPSVIAGRPTTLGGEIRAATSNDDERIAAMLRGDPIPPARSLFNPSTWFN